jgi:phosphatidylglycerophosphate synthase
MFLALGVIGYLRGTAPILSRANVVTALRFLSIGGLLELAITEALGGYWLALGGTAILISDALDGWMARRHDRTTRLGGLFDEEVDAFFLLALCVVAFLSARTGGWVLIPGLLHYGFVLGRPLLERGKAPAKIRSRRARLLFVVMMIAMITTLLPLPELYLPATMVAAVLLIISFLIDAWTLMRAPAAGAVVDG